MTRRSLLAGASALPVLAAAAILLLSNGARQSLGLFIDPIHASTAIPFERIALALAIGQFVWGAAQPLFGAIADRHGTAPVVVAGALLMSVAFVLTPWVGDAPGLTWTLGVVGAAGAGAASVSIVMAAVARRVAPQQRGPAAGIVNAGASLGQFLFAPLCQWVMQLWGWAMAMWVLAALMLATLPLALPLRGRAPGAAVGAEEGGHARLGPQLRAALRDRDYLLLNAGFFTCGFHIAFLVTHLPTQVRLCGWGPSVAATAISVIGLTNIAGSLGAGWLGNRVRLKWLLSWMYGIRALAVALYLLAPTSTPVFYVFACVLGLTWLSTIPPTAGLVAKLHGTRFLATLFGLTLVAHQSGAFFGAWLGGIALEQFGNYRWMWIADILLAAAAALIHLPIREAAPAVQSARSLPRTP